MSLLLIILLVVILVGALPTWGYHSYGYMPGGIVGILLLVLLILFVSGRL